MIFYLAGVREGESYFISQESEKEKEGEMEEDEAKRIVESMTDSITSGEKQDMEDSTKAIRMLRGQVEVANQCPDSIA